MRLRWNGEVKKLIAGMGLFLAAILVIANLGIGIFRNQMRREYTALAAGILENMEQATEGMASEIAFAAEQGIEVRFMEPEELEGGGAYGDGAGADASDGE